MSKMCGYCRQEGHRADKCEEKKNIRIKILTHTPKERKWTLEYMVKQGFGEGCVFRIFNGYTNTAKTVMLTNPDFVINWQFCIMKKVRYSKQIRLVTNHGIERDEDTGSVSKNQYDYLRLTGLSFGEGTASVEQIRVPVAYIVNPKTFSETEDIRFSGMPIVLEPSFKMFDIDPALYAKNVHIHRRVSGPSAILHNEWDQLDREDGIIPT